MLIEAREDSQFRFFIRDSEDYSVGASYSIYGVEVKHLDSQTSVTADTNVLNMNKYARFYGSMILPVSVKYNPATFQSTNAGVMAINNRLYRIGMTEVVQ